MTGGYVSWSGVLIRRWGICAVAARWEFRSSPSAWARQLPTSFIPEEDQGYAFLQIQLPDAASLQRTDAVMRKIDDMLAHTHGVQSFSGISGFSLLSNTSASYTGFYFLQLEPWDDRLTDELSAQGLMRNLNKRMASEIPEAIGFAFGPPAIPGLGTAGGFTFMLQDRSGGTVTQLSEMLDKLTLAARKTAGDCLARKHLPPVRASTLCGSGPGSRTEAGSAVRRGLPDATGVPRRCLRQSVQSIRPPVEGVSPGGTGVSHQRR